MNMKKIGFIVFISSVIVFIYVLSRTPSKIDSFQGTWETIEENKLTGIIYKSTVRVFSSEDKFRIEAEDIKGKSVTIFDGKKIYSISDMFVQRENKEKLKPYSGPQRVIRDIEEDENLDYLRFWLDYPQESMGEGGAILGRETVIYFGQESHKDGIMTTEALVDKKTRLLLSSQSTVFSKKSGGLISKKKQVCRELTMGPLTHRMFEYKE